MSLNTLTRGEGTTTQLLLHGFLGSARNLSSLARRWSARTPGLRLVAADLTGHGDSPPLPHNPSIQDVARDVLELMRVIGATSVLGHSFGGRVALSARLLDPDQVREITLLDISPSPTDALAAAQTLKPVLQAFLDAPDGAANREAMAEVFRSKQIPEPLTQWLLLNLSRTPAGVTWKVDRAALGALSRASSSLDLWSAVEHQSGSTRCIRGGRSPYVSDPDAKRLRSAGCEVHTVAEAGHFVHAEALDALVDILRPGDRHP